MHCLALSEDKNVFAAGKNWSGQLGVGDANVKYLKQLSPIAAGPWDGHTSMITCGSSFSSFSAILTDDGCIRTFGQYTDHIHPSVWALLSAHVSRCKKYPKCVKILLLECQILVYLHTHV